MTAAREERIRAKAHALWEADGRPQGRDRAHWEQAAKLVDEEDRKAAQVAVDPQQSKPNEPSATNEPVGVTLAAMKRPN